MSRSGKSFLFLVSTGAGRQRAPERLAKMLARRPEIESRSMVRRVDTASDALAALRDLTPSGIVIAAGGDGTVNLAASALHSLGLGETPLGVVPLGTGNAFAHSLSLGGAKDALRAIERGGTRKRDLIVTTIPEVPVAVCSVSVGWESRFIEVLSRHRGDRAVQRAIAWTLSSALGRVRGIRLRVDGDEWVEPEQPVFNAGFYNTPCYAMGRRLLPDADSGDGRLEAIVHRGPRAYWRTLATSLRTLRPTKRADPQWKRATEGLIDCRHPIQVDGDSLPPQRAFELRAERGAITVITGA